MMEVYPRNNKWEITPIATMCIGCIIPSIFTPQIKFNQMQTVPLTSLVARAIIKLDNI